MRKYLSIFLIFIFLFTFIFTSYNNAYASVSSTIKYEIASILAIGSLLVHGGFTFTSRDSLFAFSKRIYHTLDSGSLSNLQDVINGYKAISSLPYNTIKAIYDLAKSYLTSSSITESLYDSTPFPSGAFSGYYDAYSELKITYSSGSYDRFFASSDNKYVYHYKYSSDGNLLSTKITDWSSYNVYSIQLYIEGDSAGYYSINYAALDSSGKVMIGSSGYSLRVGYGVGPGTINLIGDTVYPEVTINPSSDVVFDGRIDTDSLANDISSGKAGSISAPVYVPDIPSDASSASDVLNTNLDILLKTTTSLVDTNVQTLSVVKSISATLSNVLSSVKSIASSLTDGLIGDVSKVNFQPLKVSASALTKNFPFSLPWDLYNSVNAVVASGSIPDIDLIFYDPVNKTIIHNNVNIGEKFPAVVQLAPVIRSVFLFGFAISLIFATRRLLGGAE